MTFQYDYPRSVLRRNRDRSSSDAETVFEAEVVCNCSNKGNRNVARGVRPLSRVPLPPKFIDNPFIRAAYANHFHGNMTSEQQWSIRANLYALPWTRTSFVDLPLIITRKKPPIKIRFRALDLIKWKIAYPLVQEDRGVADRWMVTAKHVGITICVVFLVMMVWLRTCLPDAFKNFTFYNRHS